MDYQQAIIEAAGRYGVPPSIALGVAQQESGLQHYDASGNVIRGAAGEVGLFQLMPGTAAELGVNPFDPRQNIEGGVRYLAQMHQATGGSWPDALIAYNAGIGNWTSVIQGSPTVQAQRAYNAGAQYSQQVMMRAGLPTMAPGGSPPLVPPVPEWSFGDWWAQITGQITGQAPQEQAGGGDVVFRAEATAQRPHTALYLVLGLLGTVVLLQLTE